MGSKSKNHSPDAVWKPPSISYVHLRVKSEFDWNSETKWWNDFPADIGQMWHIHDIKYNFVEVFFCPYGAK